MNPRDYVRHRVSTVGLTFDLDLWRWTVDAPCRYTLRLQLRPFVLNLQSRIRTRFQWAWKHGPIEWDEEFGARGDKGFWGEVVGCVFFRLSEWDDLYSAMIIWQDSYELFQKAFDKSPENAIQNTEKATPQPRVANGVVLSGKGKWRPRHCKMVPLCLLVRGFEIPVAGLS